MQRKKENRKLHTNITNSWLIMTFKIPQVLLLIILLGAFQTLFAQEGPITIIEKKGDYYKAIEFNVKPNTFYSSININFKASSVNLEVAQSNIFEKAYLLLGGIQKFELAKDAHQSEVIENLPNRNSQQSSALYIANQPFEFISFYSGNLQGKIRMNLLYASPLKLDKLVSSKKKSPVDCSEEPQAIDQSIWRTGLPEPTGIPLVSQVKHVILHHAAGSNTATNYTDIVRNYYLLHTQTNGWDDIGYNYLVAQNGDIYNGRDGDTLGDDNIIGAHMCARNTNTMGICLLGNYEKTGFFPTDTSLKSVEQIITWKLFKEQLNPFDSSLHPVAAPVHYLGVIAGHKDGCNPGYTECPGIDYYNIIYNTIKQDVAAQLANCIPQGIEDDRLNEIKIYPNPIQNGLLKIESEEPITKIELLNILGQKILLIEKKSGSNNVEINMTKFQNGSYILLIQLESGQVYRRIEKQE